MSISAIVPFSGNLLRVVSPAFGKKPVSALNPQPLPDFHIELPDDPDVAKRFSIQDLGSPALKGLYYRNNPDVPAHLVAKIKPGEHDELNVLAIKDGSVVIDHLMPAAHRDAWIFSGGHLNDRADGTVVDVQPQETFESVYREATERLRHAPLTSVRPSNPESLVHMQVVQPVGGEGSRLFPLTQLYPKPAVPINREGITLIGSTIQQLQAAGAAQIHVTTRVHPERIAEALVGLNPVQQVYEGQKALGDFGAVARALVKLSEGKSLDPSSDPHLNLDNPLLLVFGDAYIQGVDFGRMLERHQQRHAGISILTMEVPREQASRFGILSLVPLPHGHEGLQQITEFNEKPEHPASNVASTGIIILSPEVLKTIPHVLKDLGVGSDQSVNLGKILLPTLIEQLNQGQIRDSQGNAQITLAQPLRGLWLDVGNHGTYFAVRRHEDQLTDEQPVYWHGLKPANQIKATGNVLFRSA